MKKTFVLLCIIILSISFVGCGIRQTAQNTVKTNEPVKEAETEAVHTHSFGEWTVVKEATCTEDGLSERYCDCGEKESKTIEKTGHSFGRWTNTTAATCSAQGVDERTCSKCGKQETRKTAKTSHTFTSQVTKEPTCTVTGMRKKTCTKCGYSSTEIIDALGHNPDNNFICKRCGAKCPKTVNMSAQEKENASNVNWLSQRSFDRYDDDKMFRLFFGLKSDETEDSYMKVPAVVDIRIENDKGETVYQSTKIVRSSDYGRWGNDYRGYKTLCAIVIKDSEITPGTTKNGKVYFTITNSGYFNFDESTLTVNDLPVKASTVKLPSTPITLNYYSYGNHISATFKVTSITYEIDDDDLYIYFAGEKTYDDDGRGQSDTCRISWKLYDEENYVVNSGTFYSESIAVGEKFRNGREICWGCIEPGHEYKLVILNTNNAD